MPKLKNEIRVLKGFALTGTGMIKEKKCLQKPHLN